MSPLDVAVLILSVVFVVIFLHIGYVAFHVKFPGDRNEYPSIFRWLNLELCIMMVLDMPLITINSIFNLFHHSQTILIILDIFVWNALILTVFIHFWMRFYSSIFHWSLMRKRWEHAINGEARSQMESFLAKHHCIFGAVACRIRIILVFILLGCGTAFTVIFLELNSNRYSDITNTIILHSINTFVVLCLAICAITIHYYLKIKEKENLETYAYSLERKIFIRSLNAQTIATISITMIVLIELILIICNIGSIYTFLTSRYLIVTCLVYSFVVNPIQNRNHQIREMKLRTHTSNTNSSLNRSENGSMRNTTKNVNFNASNFDTSNDIDYDDDAKEMELETKQEEQEYHVDLSDILRNQAGLRLFAQFLSDQLAIENILFLIELIQIKYYFRVSYVELRSKNVNKSSNWNSKISKSKYSETLFHVLKVNDGGFTGIPIYARFFGYDLEDVGVNRSVVTELPKELPVSKILLANSILLDQMKAIYDKYVRSTGGFQLNLSHDIRNALRDFFDEQKSNFKGDGNGDSGREDALNRMTANIFDDAALQILSLMNNSYMRFKKSEQFPKLKQILFTQRSTKSVLQETEISDGTNEFDLRIKPKRRPIDQNHKDSIINQQFSTRFMHPTQMNDVTRRIEETSEHDFKSQQSTSSVPSRVTLSLKNTEVSNSKSSKSNPRTTVGAQWVVHEVIGKGAFGIVHRGTNSFINCDVALKFMIKNASKYHQQTALNEIKILKKLTNISHPNVIRLDYQDYNYVYTTKNGKQFDTVLLVMEYASNGQLFDILRYSGAFSESVARAYFHQIISALKCFHEHNIIHRDLKPENILLDSMFNLKICDFGLSVVVENGNTSIIQKGRVGTKGYMAPEILNKQTYDESCDIFSTGVILYNLLTARSPFKEASSQDKKYKLLALLDEQTNKTSSAVILLRKEFWQKSNKNKNKNNTIKDERVQDLFEQMVKYSPSKRIKIEQIEQHPWCCSNDLLNHDRLFDVMSGKYKQTLNAKKLISSQEAMNDNEHIIMGGSNGDIIDQEKTVAEFESALSRFGVSVANASGMAQSSLAMINENEEVEVKTNGGSVDKTSSKGLSLLQSMVRAISNVGDRNSDTANTNAVNTGNAAASQLSQYMSSKVTSEIKSWKSVKCYTIRDPLVIMIGIGDYHDKLQNLIGMTKDYKNMIYTFNNKFCYSFCYKTHDNRNFYSKNDIIDLNNAHISKNVKIEWDVNEILDFMEYARNVIVSNKHDSLILILSSHGDSDGVIYDSEFEALQLFEIFHKFMRQQCPYLQDKPKIVFVDACRGNLKSWIKKPPPRTKKVFKSRNHNADEKDIDDDDYTPEQGHGRKKNVQSDAKQEDNVDNEVKDDEKEESENASLDVKMSNNISINNKNINNSKLESKLLKYHNEGNYRVIYANVDGYAVLEAGKSGGYLLQSVKQVFCNEKRMKDTDFSVIIKQINATTQNMASNGYICQQVQDVDQMDGIIKFEKKVIHNQ